MDNQLPEKNQDQPKVFLVLENIRNKLGKNKLILSTTLALAVFLAAILFYLKIQHINKPIPKTPASKVTSQNTQSFPPPTAFQKGPFACPGIPQFCLSGKDIFIGADYIGFGSKLTAKSPIFASFNGNLTTSKITVAQSPTNKKTQDILVATLTDKAHLLRAAYYFTGQSSKDRIVKQGEIIATSSGELIPLYGDSSLVFVLTRNDTTMGKRLGGERMRLTRENFK